jgi:hypothetical protein
MRVNVEVPDERVLPPTGGKCPGCGFFFTPDNPRQDDGYCLLCNLQACGRIVIYAEIGDATGGRWLPEGAKR